MTEQTLGERKLIFQRAESFTGWLCSDCRWSYAVTPAGDSASQAQVMAMKASFETHDCAQPQRPATWPTGERRYPRYALERPVKVSLQMGKGRDPVLLGQTCDLSEGGLGATLPLALDLSERVVLELADANNAPLQLPAAVRHRRNFLHGFEFLGIAAEARQAIAELCARNGLRLPA